MIQVIGLVLGVWGLFEVSSGFGQGSMRVDSVSLRFCLGFVQGLSKVCSWVRLGLARGLFRVCSGLFVVRSSSFGVC